MCSGDGSFSNPYTIENLIINATNSPIGCGILISSHGDEYFNIKNCTIFTSGTSSNSFGIVLQQADNGTLIDNDCSGCINGITLMYSFNCTINDNTVNNNDWNGISANLSSSIIFGNIVNNNHYSGINITSNLDTTISGNTLTNNDISGIYLRGCNNSIISENSLEGNDIGILTCKIWTGTWPHYPNYNITIIDNTVENNHQGLDIRGTHNGEIKYNSIIFSNEYGISIEGSTEIVIILVYRICK